MAQSSITGNVKAAARASKFDVQSHTIYTSLVHAARPAVKSVAAKTQVKWSKLTASQPIDADREMSSDHHDAFLVSEVRALQERVPVDAENQQRASLRLENFRAQLRESLRPLLEYD